MTDMLMKVKVAVSILVKIKNVTEYTIEVIKRMMRLDQISKVTVGHKLSNLSHNLFMCIVTSKLLDK